MEMWKKVWNILKPLDASSQMFFAWNHGADKAQSKRLPTLPLKKWPTCRNRDAIRGYYLSICKQSSILANARGSRFTILISFTLLTTDVICHTKVSYPLFTGLSEHRVLYPKIPLSTCCLSSSLKKCYPLDINPHLHPGVPTIHDILDELLCSSGMVEPQLVQHHCMFNVYLYTHTHINPHIHTYHAIPYHTITLHCITWLDMTLHMYLFVYVYI